MGVTKNEGIPAVVLSIDEAVRIARRKAPVGEVSLRKLSWAFADDHIIVKYDRHGILPWVKMRFPTSGPELSMATEQDVVIGSFDCSRADWVAYVAPRGLADVERLPHERVDQPEHANEE